MIYIDVRSISLNEYYQHSAISNSVLFAHFSADNIDHDDRSCFREQKHSGYF